MPLSIYLPWIGVRNEGILQKFKSVLIVATKSASDVHNTIKVSTIKPLLSYKVLETSHHYRPLSTWILQVCPVILRLTESDSMDDYRTEAVAVSSWCCTLSVHCAIMRKIWPSVRRKNAKSSLSQKCQLWLKCSLWLFKQRNHHQQTGPIVQGKALTIMEIEFLILIKKLTLARFRTFWTENPLLSR